MKCVLIMKLLVCTRYSLPLIDIAAATQTDASQEALMQFIDFNDEHNTERAERYLLAVAMTTHPTNNTVTDLLVSNFYSFIK